MWLLVYDLSWLSDQKDVYAILVSGSGKTQAEQNMLDGDVKSLFNILTDPKILGLR